MPTDPLSKIAAATSAEMSAHTEQALLELVYVRTANEMIGNAMGSLDSALNTTQSVLNILQGLQNLKNDISVKSKSAFNFNYITGVFGSSTIVGPRYQGNAVANGAQNVRQTLNRTTAVITSGAVYSWDVTQYQATYNYFASQYFGKAIDPFFVFSNGNDPKFGEFASSLTALKNSLQKEIAILTKQTAPASRNDPNSLLATLQKVYNDLPQNTKNFASVEKWVLDNYNAHGSGLAGSAGALQNDLTFAITAAQQLNDSQKEKVRRFLFIFQEYYQSASAVLAAITHIVQSMAQKISQ